MFDVKTFAKKKNVFLYPGCYVLLHYLKFTDVCDKYIAILYVLMKFGMLIHYTLIVKLGAVNQEVL